MDIKGLVEKREKLTRAKRWEAQDEDEAYNSRKFDRDMANYSQIRKVIKTFRANLPEIFPEGTGTDSGYEVPKTHVFAKTDSHADDIIQIVREEFGEEKTPSAKKSPSRTRKTPSPSSGSSSANTTRESPSPWT